MRSLQRTLLALGALGAASCGLFFPFADPQSSTSGTGGSAIATSASTSGSIGGASSAIATATSASGTGGTAAASGAGGTGGGVGGASGSGGFVCGSNELAQWKVGQIPANRFVSNGQGDTVDNYTGLIWQNGPADQPTQIAMVSLLSQACKGPWRLPTQQELFSVLLTTSAPDVGDAPWGLPLAYWSSSLHANNSSERWSVDFSFPNGAWGLQYINMYAGITMDYVRCVQSTKTPKMGCQRFDVGMTTTTDKVTGLTWERTPSSPILDPKNSPCASGEHVPTLEELLTIVDPTAPFYVAADAMFNVDIATGAIWSSTPSGQAYNFEISLSSGLVLIPPNANADPVLCVK